MQPDTPIDKSDTRATDGMGGDGLYDGHSETQRDIVVAETDRLRKMASELAIGAGELAIVDYGSGPGRNSMVAFHVVLDEIARRSADQPVVCVHNDQAGNDWNGLFANVAGPEGYLADGTNRRAAAAVGSFFGPVAGASSVDLGMSFMAAHWFDHGEPLPSPGTMFFAKTEGETRRRLAQTADDNWTLFLQHRARELKPGGWLLVQTLATHAASEAPDEAMASNAEIYQAFWDCAETLAGDGLIDPAVLENFVFPCYFRAPDELRAPLERDSDLKNAFELVELAGNVRTSPLDGFLERTGDIDGYAARWADHIKAFSASAFANGLFLPSTGSVEDAARLSDLFFDRLRQHIRDTGGHFGGRYRSATIMLKRR
jgi:hypothetical protein